LNSGLCTCKAGALPPGPHLQSILFWLFRRWWAQELFAGLALNCGPPDLSLPSSWDYRPEPNLQLEFEPRSVSLRSEPESSCLTQAGSGVTPIPARAPRGLCVSQQWGTLAPHFPPGDAGCPIRGAGAADPPLPSLQERFGVTLSFQSEAVVLYLSLGLSNTLNPDPPPCRARLRVKSLGAKALVVLPQQGTSKAQAGDEAAPCCSFWSPPAPNTHRGCPVSSWADSFPASLAADRGQVIKVSQRAAPGSPCALRGRVRPLPALFPSHFPCRGVGAQALVELRLGP
jgi:hypothetical protein